MEHHVNSITRKQLHHDLVTDLLVTAEALMVKGDRVHGYALLRSAISFHAAPDVSDDVLVAESAQVAALQSDLGMKAAQ